MIGTTPPPLQGPSSKEKKYDRQLRLWAASGQAALEEAHILLINSGPGVIGVEALKNLVLPGIGQFTILDSAVVDDADLGVNFFLDEDCRGGFRAEHTCKLLQELNPDVRGHFITEPVESFIQDSSALSPYTIVLAIAPLDPNILAILSEHSTKTRVPLLHIHSIGFHAHFSISLPSDFPVVDTHPDPVTATDLRMLAPWPELKDLAAEKTADLEHLPDHDHGHVPYVLLLMHYLERWKREHGSPPKEYKRKTAFREMVRQGARTKNAEGGEENFDEAVGAVLKALNPPSLSSAVKEVFAAAECQQVTKQSASFWLIASAISTFFSKNGVLPLPGSLPDMKAQSADYIALQNVYKKKARDDVADVLSTVRELEGRLNRETSIDEKEVESFCRNAAHIKVIRGRPLALPPAEGEDIRWGDQASSLATSLLFPNTPVPLYLAMLAWDIFTTTHSRPPGADAQHPPTSGMTATSQPHSSASTSLETDTAKLTGIAITLFKTLLQSASTSVGDEDDELRSQIANAAGELARAGGAELHNTAALAGGLVAQEVIKIVTGQYVPVDNVCVWDGVSGRCGVLRV